MQNYQYVIFPGTLGSTKFNYSVTKFAFFVNQGQVNNQFAVESFSILQEEKKKRSVVTNYSPELISRQRFI